MSKNLAFEEPVIQLREKIDELKTIATKTSNTAELFCMNIVYTAFYANI